MDKEINKRLEAVETKSDQLALENRELDKRVEVLEEKE